MIKKGFWKQLRLPRFRKLPQLRSLLRLPRFKPIKEWKIRLQLRVFHKIFLILLVLLGFIAVEGYLNLKNIDQMQLIVKDIFQQGNITQIGLFEAQQNIKDLRLSYVRYLTGADSFISNSLLMNLANVGLSENSQHKLDEIGELLRLPPTEGNYQRIDQALVMVELEINNLVNEAKSKSIQLMNNGNQFVDGTKKVTLFTLLAGFVTALVLGIIVATSISGPLKKTARMIQEMSQGHLGMRLKIRRKDEIGVMAKSMDQFADELQESVIGAMQRIAAGDLTVEVSPHDDQDEIQPALRTTVESLRRLASDAKMLSQAAVEGRFETRADTDNYRGDYRVIVEGINATLDTVVGGIDYQTTEIVRLASNLQRLAIGDLDLDLTVAEGNEGTAAYQENFTRINQDLKMVQASLESIQEMAVQVARGDLSRLEEFSLIRAERSEKDRLIPAFIQMMETIREMAGEANRLTQAAIEGKLETRGAVDKFEGYYRSVVEGINQTLDAIGAPIKETLQTLDRMVGNDYTCLMNTTYQGEFKQLADAVNRVQDTLNQTLREINISAEQIANGSKQVADGSDQVSQGATAQAASVEELSATIMQIATQTRENAASAENANQVALTAKTMAEQGNDQMQGMLQAMAEIRRSSEGISKIIKVIDEIAFQTNILALNAAIEAARAGQYGRGFAVVAQEVRSLAGRSADAAKETTNMIESSIKKVKDGTGITEAAAVALTQIVNGVSQATGLVGNIAAASEQQAVSINQLTEGIEQVSRVVQANTATAEESAATCQELSGQAAVLKEMVNQFKLKEVAGMAG